MENEDHEADAPTGPLPVIGGVADPSAEVSPEDVRRLDLMAAAVLGVFLIMALGILVAATWN